MRKISILIFIIFINISCFFKPQNIVCNECEIIRSLSDSLSLSKLLKSEKNAVNYYTGLLSKRSGIMRHMASAPDGRNYPNFNLTKSLYMFDLLIFSNYFNCKNTIMSKVKIGKFSEYELQLISFWNEYDKNRIDTTIIHALGIQKYK